MRATSGWRTTSFSGEAHDRDIVEAAQRFQRIGEARTGRRPADQPGSGRRSPPCASPSPSLVRNIFICTGVVFCASSRIDEGMCQGAAAHEGDRAPPQARRWRAAFELICRQHVVSARRRSAADRDRPCRADRRAESPAARRLRPRARDRMNPLDLAGHHKIDRGGQPPDRSCRVTGRAQTEHQFVLAHRLDVGSLAGGARRDPALAGTETGVLAPQG